jgi:type IX secretion system PorP/SprF family membrane protein
MKEKILTFGVKTGKRKKYENGRIFIRFCFCLLLCIVASQTASAQFDGYYSQYMNNLAVINPAYSGEQEMVQVSIFQRNQWVGFKGAPITSLLSVDMPFKIGNTENGAGIQFLSDVFGLFANQQANILYSYKYRLKNGQLSIGTNIGFVNLICYGDTIHIPDDNDYHKSKGMDDALPTNKESGVGFDLGLGAKFEADNFRIGLYVNHLPAPRIALGENAEMKISPIMQFHTGYDIKTRNPAYKVRTNMYIFSDFSAWTAHISGILDIKNKFWAGAGYGIQSAVSLMFGIKLFEGFKIGYTFDLPTTSVIAHSFGSHEIFATYEFALVREKSKATKSIRIL